MKKLPVKPLPKVMHNHLSAPALLNQVRRDFEKVGDPRRYGQQFSLTDVLMSGLAVFGLKFPSLLKFDENRNEVRIRANLQSLYASDYPHVASQHSKRLIWFGFLSNTQFWGIYENQQVTELWVIGCVIWGEPGTL